jgi:hypothetical protein
VVLGGKYELSQSARLARRDNLLGAELCRIEERGILITHSPFAVGEGVYREVQKSVGFKVMPRSLTRRGQGPKRLGCCARRLMIPCEEA